MGFKELYPSPQWSRACWLPAWLCGCLHHPGHNPILLPYLLRGWAAPGSALARVHFRDLAMPWFWTWLNSVAQTAPASPVFPCQTNSWGIACLSGAMVRTQEPQEHRAGSQPNSVIQCLPVHSSRQGRETSATCGANRISTAQRLWALLSLSPQSHETKVFM